MLINCESCGCPINQVNTEGEKRHREDWQCVDALLLRLDSAQKLARVVRDSLALLGNYHEEGHAAVLTLCLRERAEAALRDFGN